MKKYRKTIGIILVIMLIAIAPAFINGDRANADSTNVAAQFVIGQTSYTVNGATAQMDVAPYIENGRTFLPIRYAAYAVGVTDSGITWDGTTNTATIVKGSDTIVLVVGNTTMTLNGKVTVMDVAPEIVSGRVMLPIRFVGEALGATVAWDQASKTVTLTMGNAVAPPIIPPIVPPIVPPAASGVDMTAALNGTLKAPAGAVATPIENGFAPLCKEIKFTAGNQTATLTALDGSTRDLDLGTAPMVVTDNADDLIQHFPGIYKIGTTVEIAPNGPFALYAPFIPIAEAFGVPAANIEWDGTHLAVFGWFQHADNYIVLTVGSRDVIGKVDGNSPAVATGSNALSFPLVALNGQPALGISSVSDFAGLIFDGQGTPGLINAGNMGGDSWNYATGAASVATL
jgi:hypothetical protein